MEHCPGGLGAVWLVTEAPEGAQLRALSVLNE